MPHLSTPVNLENAGIAISINRTHIGKKSKDDADWGKYNRSFKLEAMNIVAISESIRSGFAITAAHHSNRHTDNYISAQHLGLDYDHSSISDLINSAFIADYASVVHTTSSHTEYAPRSRVLFVLDRPIYDARLYSEYARAMVWHSNLADPLCSDAVRVWYGAKDCNMQIQQGKVLPVELLEGILAEYKDSQKTLPENDGFIDGDPNKLLDNALKSAERGMRHHIGFKLCCGLRDIGVPMDEAVSYLEIYQQAVKNMGDHPYEMNEILASLRGAYSRKPKHFVHNNLSSTLSSWENSAWFGRRGLKHGGIHYSLKTVMAVSQIAEKVGRTNDIALPVRDFIEYGVPKNAASAHLKAMQDAGIIKLDAKSDTRRASRYSLILSSIPDVGNQEIDVTTSAIYKHLQGFPHFDHKARIDPKMWKSKADDLTLGPSALRILSTLAISTGLDIGAMTGQSRRGVDCSLSSYDCPVMAPISSMQELWRVSGVAERTGKRVFKAMCELGICQWEYADENEKSKIPSLAESWYEQLQRIAPALTTYGKKEVLKEKYNIQREIHHGRKSGYGTDDDRDLSESIARGAYEKMDDYRSAAESIKVRREGWLSTINS